MPPAAEGLAPRNLIVAEPAPAVTVARMAQPDPPDLFLNKCNEIHSIGAGTAETSFYPALAIPSTRPGVKKDWRLTNRGNGTVTGVMPGRGHVAARPYAVEEAATEAQAVLPAASPPSCSWAPRWTPASAPAPKPM